MTKVIMMSFVKKNVLLIIILIGFSNQAYAELGSNRIGIVPLDNLLEGSSTLEVEIPQIDNMLNEKRQELCSSSGGYWNSVSGRCDAVVRCDASETSISNVCVDKCNPRGLDSHTQTSLEYDHSSDSCVTSLNPADDGSAEFEPDCVSAPGVTCPQVTPEPTVTDLETCRDRGYTGDDCSSWSTEKAEDERTIAEKEQSLQAVCAESEGRARSTCTQYVQKAQQVSSTGGGSGGGSVNELACSAVEKGKAASSEVSQLKTSCESIVRSCNSVCNRTVSVLWTSVSVNDSRCNESVLSQLSQPFNTQVSALQASISSSQNTCNSTATEPEVVAAEEEVPQESTPSSGNQFLDQATQLAAVGAQFAAGSGAGELSGGSGSSGGYSGNSNFDSSYNPNGRGNSTGSLGDSGRYTPTASVNTDGVPDEPVLSGRGGTSRGAALQSATGGPPGLGNTARAGGNFGAAGNPSRLGANAGGKEKRYKTAKSRNLINGFKTVKASDGGGSLSIRSADFKKFGALAMKQKLKDARSKHGKDLPLIFRNGKFVLDFLAMKESKAFKARTAAMESYLKGGSRDVASARQLYVHQNPKLNIFKIMNFRYHRQSLKNKNL